jgi:hypothetical protein
MLATDFTLSKETWVTLQDLLNRAKLPSERVLQG